jgi:very-short-patch-repair endonuclease
MLHWHIPTCGDPRGRVTHPAPESATPEPLRFGLGGHVQHRSPAIVQLRARQHRSRLTESEALLWQHLRGCRLGVWFRRQVAIGRFIVDFLAPSAKLIVEVDGGYHSTRANADARRDHQLARSGYRMVRIDSELVRHDPAKAIALIQAALHAG